MKKTEAPAFADFMLDEATKYGRELQKAEIDLWFETFQRCTLEDFRLAWVAHKRDDKNGNFFPKIPWLQRHLRVTGDENAKRDWRCEVTVGDAPLQLSGCRQPEPARRRPVALRGARAALQPRALASCGEGRLRPGDRGERLVQAAHHLRRALRTE
jgi:hypothetical protein